MLERNWDFLINLSIIVSNKLKLACNNKSVITQFIATI